MKKLEKLRANVQQIDRDIIRMIGKRIELTRAIGKVKKNAGLPLLNYQIEKAVIENARAVADDFQLSPDFIKSVIQLLIGESRTQQEQLHYSGYCGNKETILIIGGMGEMGRWLANFFDNQGHEVLIYDICEAASEFQVVATLAEGLQRASCAVVSVSLDVVPETIDQIVALNFKGLIFDIASVKSHLIESIERAKQKGALITSIHPMFGPGARTLSDKAVCFCDCGNAEALERSKGFFRETAVRSVDLALDSHDKAISYVLGLSHIINIIFMNVLSKSGFRYSDLKEIASTTFLSQMITATSVINENPDLYFLIQRYNPFTKEIYDQIKNAMKTTVNTVVHDRRDIFARSMLESKEWLSEPENRERSEV